MSYKNLYVNGCSFTAGDNVEEGKTWPENLATLTNTVLHQDARNGNSMETIFNVTLNNLIAFSPEDTLVIIGQTWKERYCVPYKDVLVNITPADVGCNKTSFMEKLSTYRRVTSTLATTKYELTDSSRAITKNEEELSNFNKTLRSYVDYYESLITYDTNLEYNQALLHFNYLYSLENFLKLHKYNYYFIDFQGYFEESPGGSHKYKNVKVYNKIDKTRIIPMQWADFKTTKNSTSHPTAEDCVTIANLIKQRL